MKENFSELYARLYNENISELEELRQKEKKTTSALIIGIIVLFLLGTINPILVIIGMIGIFIYLGKKYNRDKVKVEKQTAEVVNQDIIVEDEDIISEKKVENASLTEMLKLQEAIETGEPWLNYIWKREKFKVEGKSYN